MGDMESKHLGIGMIGYGGIGRVHAANWRNLHLYYEAMPYTLRMRHVATSHHETAELAARMVGFEKASIDYLDVVHDPLVDLVDICVPNALHHPAFMEAIKSGKHVYCEKPLARNLSEAEEMRSAALSSDSIVQIAFNYRFIPAVARGKSMIESGFLGDTLIFRTQYLHSSYLDPQRPISWRLLKEQAGGGALVDLGSHAIDLMRYLAGEFKRVRAQTRTFIPSRPIKAGSDQLTTVDVDDHALLEVELVEGGLGTIEVSRVTMGSTDDLRFEIHGTRGAIAFDVMQPNWLLAFNARGVDDSIGDRRGYTHLQTMHHYPSRSIPGSRSMVSSMQMHADCQYRMLEAIAGRRGAEPSSEDGYWVQMVIDAAYRSAQSNKWIELPQPCASGRIA
jgi:predicted dehydrogenase